MTVLDLNRSVPALVGIFESIYTQASTQMIRKHFGMSLTEARIILLVGAEPGIPGLRVSKAFGIDPSLVSRSLRGLVARDLINVTRDTRHVRKQSLTLTEEGRRLHDGIVRLSLEREAVLLANFSPIEHEMLLSLLQKLLSEMRAANDFALTV